MRVLLICLVISVSLKSGNTDVPCGCYMLGTQENSEGKSICNVSTGYCKCLKHVVGKNCDICEDEYFGIKSGNGCEYCSCNAAGSLSQKCHEDTGKCLCKTGFIGHKCDQCDNCDRNLAIYTECDIEGNCMCKPNAIGEKCDKCAEGYLKSNQGCEKCNDCYNTVNASMELFKEKLANVKITIESIILHKPETANWRDFDQKLKNIQDKIRDLPKLLPISDQLNILIDDMNLLANQFTNLKTEIKYEANFTLLENKLGELESSIIGLKAPDAKENVTKLKTDASDLLTRINGTATNLEKAGHDCKKHCDFLNELQTNHENIIKTNQSFINTNTSHHEVCGNTLRILIHTQEICNKTTNLTVPDLTYTDTFDESVENKLKKFNETWIKPANKAGMVDIKFLLDKKEQIENYNETLKSYTLKPIEDLPEKFSNLSVELDALEKKTKDFNQKMNNVHKYLEALLKQISAEKRLKQLIEEKEAKERAVAELEANLEEQKKTLKKIEEKFVEKTREMDELIQFLVDILDANEDARVVEEELVKLEENFFYYKILKQTKIYLEDEVNRMKIVLNSMPDGNFKCVDPEKLA